MSRQHRALTDLDSGRARRLRWIAGAAAIGFALAAGGVVWRGVHPGGATGVAVTPAPLRAATGSGTPPPVDGAPSEDAETPAGARQAAMAMVEVEGGNLMAQPDVYRAAWQRMCTAAYYAADGRAKADAVLNQQEGVNHLVSNAAQGQRVYERAVPLSARVMSGGTGVATVQTWSLLIQHPGDGPTTVAFAAGIVDLRWTADGWKLDGGSGLPTLADGTSGSMELNPGPDLPGYVDDRGGR